MSLNYELLVASDNDTVSRNFINAAVRLTAGARKFDRVTPLLKDLHGLQLRVPERILYKL